MIMTDSYSHVSFISSDPRVFVEKLRSLQSSGLADRVRVLTIWPSAIRDAIRATESERPKLRDAPPMRKKPSKHHRYFSKSLEYVEELLGGQLKSHPPMNPIEPLLFAETRQQMFKEGIRHLTSVDELELNWYFDKGGEECAWKFDFFPDIWQSVGRNVRKLSIDIQIFKMIDTVKPCMSLPKLEELHLTLRSDAARGHHGDTIIPYFVNKFSPTLQNLSIKAIGHQELSENFQLLNRFPRLRKLSLIMALDNKHLRDPSGLQQFLVNHPKIRELCIRYTRCCMDCVEDGFATDNGKHKLFGRVALPALQQLELGLHFPFPLGITSPLYDSIARMGNGVTSLTLKDRNLKLAEVKDVLRLFPSHRLKKLSLFAQLLSPQLIDYIAQTCPALNSLSLDVETVVKSEALGSQGHYKNDVAGFAQALFNYAVDLDNDRWRYRTWMLSDVSVMKWEFQVGHQYNLACMKAIAYIVPSVRSFAGRGHMEEDVMLKPGSQKLLLDLGDREKLLNT